MLDTAPTRDEPAHARWLYLFAGILIGVSALFTPHAVRSLPASFTVMFIVAWVVVAALSGYALGRREDHLEALSATDPLTGLFNRRHFERTLERELSRTARHGDPMVLMLFDLDSLKRINDGLGHDAGDEAIRSVADALRFTCRAGDLAARWGGDEFVVLAPHTDSAQAEALSKRICEAVRRVSATAHQAACLYGRQTAPVVTVSVGYGVAHPGKPSSLRPAALFADADRAMYRAKLARVTLTEPQPRLRDVRSN